MESLSLSITHAKTNGINLTFFFSSMVFLQKAKAHSMLGMVINYRFKGLRLIIQFVSKERLRLRISNEYDY
jgi:hypothetical protein